jgi:alpha-tubulin suppressor-like RCC1 family protein
MATAIQTFTATGTWTAPAGVTTVVVTPTYAPFDQYAGFQTLMFNDISGTIYGQGPANIGSFGNGVGTASVYSSPVVIAQGLRTYKVFAGFPVNYTFLIGQNGLAYGTGLNDEGGLGVGDITPRSSPTVILGGINFKQIISIAEGAAPQRIITLGLARDGTLYGWGGNTIGQLGDGTTVSKSSPVKVLGNLKFTKVLIASCPSNVAGIQTSSYGLTASGQLYAWGGNVDGQLGTGDTTNRTSPALVIGGQTWQDFTIACNGSNTSVIALNTSGVAYSWGVNVNGSRGDGGAVFKTSSPGLVSGGHTFTKIVTGIRGNAAVYGLKSNGQVWSWGDNTQGQLGLNNTTVTNTPSQVIGGLTVVDIYTNGATTQFKTSTNQLYAVGANSFGQIGDGSITPKSSPALVLGGFTWDKILVNDSFIRGVTTSGSIYQWGAITSGTDTRSSPVVVPGGLTLKTDAQSFGTMPSKTQITVVPGTSYTVTFSDEFSTFGQVPIASGTISSLTIEYDQ